jgi:two-component system, NtrC family, response regulator HydG
VAATTVRRGVHTVTGAAVDRDLSEVGTAPRLLVVDDEPSMCVVIERFARRFGFDVVRRSNGSDALAVLHETKPDVALVDLRMPGMNGLDVLRAIRAALPECQVILMTGNESIDTAIEAVRAGAIDYLRKPLDFERLGNLLTTVQSGIDRREELLRADADVAQKFEFHGMIGRSAAMQELFDAIRRLAPHVRTVLVTGETGTGKELVARALHAVGPRRDRRLVTVNCSAVVETLFESELFGHVRGAFTGATDMKTGLFEHAHGGTIFLDEVGELPLPLQAKLLRAVENGEVQRVGSLDTRRTDVTVIAATNRDLAAEVAAGRFRSDLFYRLNTITIPLVPLRDRREDIPYLIARFVRDCAARLKQPITGVSPSAERLLQHAPWRGNVRELKSVVERACIVTDNRILSEREVSAAMIAPPASGTEDALQIDAMSRPMDLSTLQREQIERVLRQVRGNKAAAAKLLGLTRQSLYRWLVRLDLKADTGRD